MLALVRLAVEQPTSSEIVAPVRHSVEKPASSGIVAPVLLSVVFSVFSMPYNPGVAEQLGEVSQSPSPPRMVQYAECTYD